MSKTLVDVQKRSSAIMIDQCLNRSQTILKLRRFHFFLASLFFSLLLREMNPLLQFRQNRLRLQRVEHSPQILVRQSVDDEQFLGHAFPFSMVVPFFQNFVGLLNERVRFQRRQINGDVFDDVSALRRTFRTINASSLHQILVNPGRLLGVDANSFPNRRINRHVMGPSSSTYVGRRDEKLIAFSAEELIPEKAQ